MKKAIALLGVLMIALSIVGFAYAHWSETIYINGEVETCDLKIGFVKVLWGDNEGEKDPPKEVGDIKCRMIDTDLDGIYDRIEVEIINGYPCYTGFVAFDVKNFGTLPVRMKVRILNPNPTAITAWMVNLEGAQLETGDVNVAQLEIHVEQEAKECNTYALTIEIEGIQWDQYTP